MCVVSTTCYLLNSKFIPNFNRIVYKVLIVHRSFYSKLPWVSLAYTVKLCDIIRHFIFGEIVNWLYNFHLIDTCFANKAGISLIFDSNWWILTSKVIPASLTQRLMNRIDPSLVVFLRVWSRSATNILLFILNVWRELSIKRRIHGQIVHWSSYRFI